MLLDERSHSTLGQVCEEIGFGAVTREDDAYLLTTHVCRRQRIEPSFIRPLIAGDEVRDWTFLDLTGAIWPYDCQTLVATASNELIKLLWHWRVQLSDRVAYGLTQIERGLKWFEYSMFCKSTRLICR